MSNKYNKYFFRNHVTERKGYTHNDVDSCVSTVNIDVKLEMDKILEKNYLDTSY